MTIEVYLDGRIEIRESIKEAKMIEDLEPFYWLIIDYGYLKLRILLTDEEIKILKKILRRAKR